MQALVYSIFVVVASVTATLAMVGLGGIIILLITDSGTSGPAEHAPKTDRNADVITRSARGAGARPAHSTVLRTSP